MNNNLPVNDVGYRTMTMTFELGDGCRMPAIGLGTFQIPPEDAEAATTTALRLGYRHVDTAEFYRNEAGIGKALAASGLARDEVYVTTKLRDSEHKTGESTIAACKQSLANLGLDYVNLYLIHTPLSGKEARLAQYSALVECKELGFCRSIGVSNYDIRHLQEISDAGLPPPAANQVELHPMCQKPELLEYMKANGKILPIAYSSLAPLSCWREGYTTMGGSKSEQAKAATPAVVATIATRLGVSEARLLLRYALQKGWPVLPKSVREDRIAANFDITSFSIPEQDMALLDGMEADSAMAFGSQGAAFDPSKAA